MKRDIELITVVNNSRPGGLHTRAQGFQSRPRNCLRAALPSRRASKSRGRPQFALLANLIAGFAGDLHGPNRNLIPWQLCPWGSCGTRPESARSRAAMPPGDGANDADRQSRPPPLTHGVPRAKLDGPYPGKGQRGTMEGPDQSCNMGRGISKAADSEEQYTGLR
jgi:hypothetical protein